MKIKYFNSNFNYIDNTKNLDNKIIEIILNLEALNIINNENLLNHTINVANEFGKNKKKIIVFGTGGSNLGARALNDIIFEKKCKIEFYDNIDPIFFSKSLLKTDFDSTGFLIISKSGTTPETLAQFSTLYQLAEEKNNLDAFLKNILVITEFKDSPLYKIANEKNCLLLEHNINIGGRYSVFSNVGIVPAIIAGLNITQLYKGVSVITDNIDKYMSLSLGKYLCNKSNTKFNSNILMTYSDYAYFFGKWYLQLWAESIGKDKKGITPIHSVGTTDQHSQLQLYLDGPRDKFFSFLTTSHSGKGMKINNDIFNDTDIDYFTNKTMGDLMEAEQKATLETFKINKFSFREIFLPKIDEENIGKLLAFSIVETVSSCIYLGVNPFNQPAVEQGKKLTKTFLK